MSAPDLRAVDDLCRLAAAARRLGCRAHLVGADADLHALLDLAGVADVLGECPAAGVSCAGAGGTGDRPWRADLR